MFSLSGGLSWERVGALPELLQTTHGSLYTGLEIDRANSLLIRGGTSSVGFAALALAKAAGLRVGVTTRNEDKAPLLAAAGADEVWVDDGEIAKQIATSGAEYERALELIGTTTLLDTLRCVPRMGIVCMTGILGGRWTLEDFHPMGDIPTGVKLTSPPLPREARWGEGAAKSATTPRGLPRKEEPACRVVPALGLEPRTYGLRIHCSNQLS